MVEFQLEKPLGNCIIAVVWLPHASCWRVGIVALAPVDESFSSRVFFKAHGCRRSKEKLCCMYDHCVRGFLGSSPELTESSIIRPSIKTSQGANPVARVLQLPSTVTSMGFKLEPLEPEQGKKTRVRAPDLNEVLYASEQHVLHSLGRELSGWTSIIFQVSGTFQMMRSLHSL